MSNKTEMIKEIFDIARFIGSNKPGSRLTMIQLRTIMYISENGLVKPTEIAKYFSITPASVTSQIDNLVKEGWLERVYNKDDKRVIEVKLTGRAKNELSLEIEKLNKQCSWIFETLDKEEEKKLLEILKKLNKKARA
jgi:DNA-binding MarR family transcriptional regulator